MYKIGSLFSGIGGFELGLERGIPNTKTVWQVEQNSFCQKVLKKHWPEAIIYDDVRKVNSSNVEKVDILCGGFPCQDISLAGVRRGIYEGKKSSLWWEFHRIISELRPRIVVLENVAAILSLGGREVVESLTEIGYDCEWSIIRSGADFGAPHSRKRWFCVAYPSSIIGTRKPFQACNDEKVSSKKIFLGAGGSSGNENKSYWQRHKNPPPLCRVDDGISDRLHRLKALGNAITPQSSEFIGRLIHQSGLLD